MKVQVDMKITILEGKEEGRTFNYSNIKDTEPCYTQCGIIERLNLSWSFIRSMSPISYMNIKELANEVDD